MIGVVIAFVVGYFAGFLIGYKKYWLIKSLTERITDKVMSILRFLK